MAAALGQELASDVRVHCDLAPTQRLWREREAYAALLASCDVPAAAQPLAELVNPLVITDDGRLKPIAYDFDARFDAAALEGLTPERCAATRTSGWPTSAISWAALWRSSKNSAS